MRVGLGIVIGLFCALYGSQGSILAAELTQEDQRTINALLGAGVMGPAVDAKPLTTALAALRAGTWTYRIVSGDNHGQTEAHVVARIKRDDTGASWRYEAGPKDILFLRVAEDNSISVVSEQDLDEGVLIRYAPGQPVLIPGLAPGDSRKFAIDVKVYDLNHPDDLQHTGKLNLTYSYLGAYRVDVPAGSYPAALIKWSYQGKVWLANIKDTQYRFVTEEVGLAASIDKEDISALLIYQDHNKTGLALEKAP